MDVLQSLGRVLELGEDKLRAKRGEGGLGVRWLQRAAAGKGNLLGSVCRVVEHHEGRARLFLQRIHLELALNLLL